METSCDCTLEQWNSGNFFGSLHDLSSYIKTLLYALFKTELESAKQRLNLNG